MRYLLTLPRHHLCSPAVRRHRSAGIGLTWLWLYGLVAAGCSQSGPVPIDARTVDTTSSMDSAAEIVDATSPMDLAPDVVDATSPMDLAPTQVQGTVNGVGMTPVTTLAGRTAPYIYVHTRLFTEFTLVVITDFLNTCESSEVAGTDLYLSLFQDPTSPESVVTAPDTFDIWLPAIDGSSTPPPRAAVLSLGVEGPSGGALSVAQSGSVVVTAVSETHIAGTFDATFLDGHLTGTFDAPICTEFKRNSSIP